MPNVVSAVEVRVGVLVIEEKRVLLTLGIAKQFPIYAPTHYRWRPMECGREVPTPICKVRTETLTSDPNFCECKWLYLVEDAVQGLVWVPPFVPELRYIELSREQGYACNVDMPADVPTILLMSDETL